MGSYGDPDEMSRRSMPPLSRDGLESLAHVLACDEHRDGRFADDLGAHAAQEELAEWPEVARADEDEVVAAGLRFGHDLLHGLAVGDLHLRLDRSLAQVGVSDGDVLVRVRLQPDVDARAGRTRVARDDAQDRNLGRRVLGELHRLLERVLAVGKSVVAEQDAHRSASLSMRSLSAARASPESGNPLVSNAAFSGFVPGASSPRRPGSLLARRGRLPPFRAQPAWGKMSPCVPCTRPSANRTALPQGLPRGARPSRSGLERSTAGGAPPPGRGA